MTDLKDTLQVGLANGTAIGVSLSEINEVLSLIALIISIAYTIFKFIKFEKNK